MTRRLTTTDPQPLRAATTFTGTITMARSSLPMRCGLAGLQTLFALSVSAQLPGTPIGRPPAGGKVPAGGTAPAPQIRSIGGSPTTTSLTWIAPPAQAKVLHFEVARWHQVNTGCCTANVVIPANGSADAKWADYDFPLSGIYVYRITSVHADGTRGTVQIDYPRPEPVNPAWLAVKPTGLGKVLLTWPEVPQASFYQLWGPAMAATGVTVANTAPAAPGTTLYQGVTQQVVDGVRYFSLELAGVPIRTPNSWSVGAFYEPPTCAAAATGQPCQKVSTAATAFTRTP